MRLQSIDPPSMQVHRRRIRQLDPVADQELETLMLPWRIPAVRLEHEPDGRQTIAVRIRDLRSELEQERQALSVQRFTRAHDRATYRSGAHRVQQPGGFDLSLQARAVECELHVLGTDTSQHLDDAVAA